MESPAVRRLDDLLAAARLGGPTPMAIAAAEDRSVLLAARSAAEAGIALPYLVGDSERITEIAAEEGIDLRSIGAEILDVPTAAGGPTVAARRAVELVRSGQASLLMKGKLCTADMLRGVLDRENGLRNGRLLSHVAVTEVPGLDRLLYITDAGVVLAPTLEQKLEIIRNGVAVARALGLAVPRVAILAAAELVEAGNPTTIEAAALAKMSERGQIAGAMVDGPFGLDNAISMAAAEAKGIGGMVAGRADVLIVPGAEAGNLMSKVITFLAGGRMAGIVVGGRVPVVVTSRADPPDGKLLSIALGAILARRVMSDE